MKEKKYDEQPAGRRLQKAVDGPLIEKWYATMPTAELAHRLGLTVKQVSDYAYRNNFNESLGKDAAERSKVASENGKKGGRPRKKN